jgi:hypothetical protein
MQSVPDWVKYRGSAKSRDQQVGNAVPYLLSIEVAASVTSIYEAATGKPGRRPPEEAIWAASWVSSRAAVRGLAVRDAWHGVACGSVSLKD